MFPRGATIEVTFGHGYNYTVAQPTAAIADAPGGTLSPGSYDVAVTAKTPCGETQGTVQQVTCASGALNVTVTPVLGATLYRAYCAPHGQTLKFVGASPHTTYGSNGMTINISSLNAPVGYWQDTLPTADTSARPYPAAFAEAVRLIFLAGLYEQNNLSNRGVGSTRSGAKTVQWRSTEGSSGKGTPLMMDQARSLLAPYATLTIA
jgi:hypothetical protein